MALPLLQDSYKRSCRICLNESEVMTSIFSQIETFHLSFAEMLMACAPILIQDNDILPTKICRDCTTTLQAAFNFRRICIASDQRLQHILEVNKNQTRIIINKTNQEDKKLAKATCELHLDSSNDGSIKSLHSDAQNNCKYTTAKTDSSNTQTRSVQCKICNKTWRNSYNLRTHMVVHTKQKPYTCEICGLTVTTASNLARHRKLHNSVKKHICEYCGKGYVQRPELTRHRRVHTGEQPFKCTKCDQHFAAAVYLKMHLNRKHNYQHLKSDVSTSKRDRQVYKCDKCVRTFSTLAHLQLHVNYHDKTLSTTCKTCRKDFANYNELQRHKREDHISARTFQCSECGKTLTSANGLRLHVLTHSGVKPHKCNFCEKSFKQLSHKVSHERLHTGSKPFRCKLCSKSFRHQTTLIDHTRIHTGEKPFKCQICNRRFYHSSNMRKHVQTHK